MAFDQRNLQVLANFCGAAADAMIARYMAKHPAAAPAPSQQPTVHRALPPQRPSFGRRIR